MDTSNDDFDADLSTPLQSDQVIPQTGEVVDENTFKILIASDIHLGYCDNDPERESDCFTTFEEILKIANDREVDFLLLGGDLFHENKPKLDCLRKTTELFRKYCLGDRPVAFEYKSDPKRDFFNQDDPGVNYYDANINIALPVFSIHGNHDDPIGVSKTSAVDHLAAAKLLNHFGQWDSLNRIMVSPVLLTKGETKLSLYGLGHMKDERLHRLMVDKKVYFVGPKEDEDDWFNILVLHQNRENRGPKSYIPEHFIPGYMNFVLWGHEHECKPQLEDAEGLTTHTKILQPGSPVATSLCAGEEKEKYCFLLNVNLRRFKLEKIKLQTVRPFVMKDVMAKEIFDTLNLDKKATSKERANKLEKALDVIVDQLIEDAEEKLTGHPDQPVKPLIRVRLFQDNMEESFNPNRFNQKFADKVANEDILVYKKTAGYRSIDGKMEIDADEIRQLVMDDEEDDLDSHVESIVENYFKLAREEGKADNLLEVLSERGLSEAVKTAVEKNEDKAIQLVIESQVEKVIQYLIEKKVTEDTAPELLENLRVERACRQDADRAEAESLLSKLKPRASRTNGHGDDDDDDDMNGDGGDDSPIELDDDDEDEAPTTSRGRGRGARGGRGSRGGRGAQTQAKPAPRGRAAAKSGGRSTRAAAAIRDESDEGESSPPPPSPASSTSSKTSTRGGRGGRGGGRAGKSAAPVMKQQTLHNFRRTSPRKASQSQAMMMFDDSD